MRLIAMRKDPGQMQSAIINEYDTLEAFQLKKFAFADEVFVVLITDSRTILLNGKWITVATLAGKPIEYRLEFRQEDEQGYPIPNGWVIRSTVIPI